MIGILRDRGLSWGLREDAFLSHIAKFAFPCNSAIPYGEREDLVQEVGSLRGFLGPGNLEFSPFADMA